MDERLKSLFDVSGCNTQISRIVLLVIDKRIDCLVFENILSYLSSMTYFAPILSTEEYIRIMHKATKKLWKLIYLRHSPGKCYTFQHKV